MQVNNTVETSSVKTAINTKQIKVPKILIGEANIKNFFIKYGQSLGLFVVDAEVQ